MGSRMKLAYTRAILNAALSGELNQVPAIPHPVFQVAVPQSCPGMPANVLDARGIHPQLGQPAVREAAPLV